ncbi:nucleic acid-binding protein, partial [candidate division MSBL1 archaeon SCGC-AAA259D14]
GSRNIEKATLSGEGKIRTFTTTYTPPLGYEEEGPYVTALVELEEGPWVPGRIDIDPEKADERGQKLLNEKITVHGEEAETEDFYPDKNRRVIPIFKLT